MKRLFSFRSSLLLLALFFFAISSCRKDIDQTILNGNNEVPNFTTKVSSSVSGFVVDETGAAVSNAVVYVGTKTATTDDYGYFSVINTSVTKTAAVVTVVKSGYFKGIKTYMAEQGKSAFFRIQLIPKTNYGTIDASIGGSVTLNNSFTVSLPANAIVNASSGLAYSGAVTISGNWIDPTAINVFQLMPGDLRGITTEGLIKRLTSYGMAAVELTGASGELLQIATGKKATLSFPIPASISSSAPNHIPLWYFDEVSGLWKEDGRATKTGSSYVGEVSHFSFWNCDVPNNYVQMSCRIIDANGNPLSYVVVKISETNNPNNARYGFTDSSGYVSGAVPDNAQLQLDVYTNYGCGTSAYAQPFTTGSSNISLGDVLVTNTSTSVANISGTVTDCSNAPVSNGYLIMMKNNQYYRYSLNNTGSFSFTSLLCGGSLQDVTFIAEDLSSGQQSSPLSFTINSGNNIVGNIQACGVTTEQFINCSINGISDNYTSPTDSFSMYRNPQAIPASIVISGQYLGPITVSRYTSFSFTEMGIAVGSTQVLQNFYSGNINDSANISAPINVNITEYGNIGEFIGGNFAGTLVGAAPNNTAYSINCNFRVRRTQ